MFVLNFEDFCAPATPRKIWSVSAGSHDVGLAVKEDGFVEECSVESFHTQHDDLLQDPFHDNDKRGTLTELPKSVQCLLESVWGLNGTGVDRISGRVEGKEGEVSST